MQVKQSVVSGNGEQKASKNSKVENVSAPKTVALNTLGEIPKSAQLQEMSAYLKIISRLENLNARQDSLPEPAIQGFIQGLEKQVAQMNDHEKALLLRIPEVKSLNVKNAEELIDRIEDKLTDGQASLKFFELLRQPQFVELIDPSRKVQTYGNKGAVQPSVASSAPVTSQQTQPPTPESNREAIATSAAKYTMPPQDSVEPSPINPRPTNA
ncbi:MAG: hypothetical protein HN867_09595 [Deltaproteobacteria bacterium]|nr:hypothetical protein [Deltaproteobacteria bacterium]